jgi:hypothetical protein
MGPYEAIGELGRATSSLIRMSPEPQSATQAFRHFELTQLRIGVVYEENQWEFYISIAFPDGRESTRPLSELQQ